MRKVDDVWRQMMLWSNSFMMTTSLISMKCQHRHYVDDDDDDVDDDDDDDDVRALLPLLSTIVEVKVWVSRFSNKLFNLQISFSNILKYSQIFSSNSNNIQVRMTRLVWPTSGPWWTTRATRWATLRDRRRGSRASTLSWGRREGRRTTSPTPPPTSRLPWAQTRTAVKPAALGEKYGKKILSTDQTVFLYSYIH